jgi:plastocyanin
VPLTKLSILLIFLISPNTWCFKGQLKAKNGGLADYSSFVVYIKNGNSLLKLKRGPKKFKMYQRNKKFIPGFLAIHKNDSVDFINQDDIFHNVFSLHPKNKFDLGTYKGGEAYNDDKSKKKNGKFKTSRKFKQNGETFVFCNIHEDMMSKLLILDHYYFSQVSKKGNFTLPKLRPGEYTLVLEGPRVKGKKEFKFKSPIAKNKKLKILITPLAENIKVKHTKKNGKSYKKEWSLDEDEFY